MRTSETVLRPLRITVFVLVQIVAVLLILEVGLRVLRPLHAGIRVLSYVPSVRTKYDEVESTRELLETSIIGYSPRTVLSGFVLNSRGFRTREYDDDKAPGTIRVLAIGDSFTFASGQLPYRRMWPTLLEDRLNRGKAATVEVLNLGVPAVGPRFELRLWELEGSRLAPDIVVLAFFVGNDFKDGRDATDRPASVNRLLAWSYTSRVVWNLSKIRAHQLGTNRPAPKGTLQKAGVGGVEIDNIDEYETQLEERRKVLTAKQHLNIQARHLDLCRPDRRDQLEAYIAALDPILEGLANGVRLADGRLLVMVIPDEYQVDRGVLERAVARAEYEGEVDVEQPQRLLKAVLEKHRIEYLDLLPVLRQEGKTRRLYGPLNTHWNVRGNEIAAVELARFIEDGG